MAGAISSRSELQDLVDNPNETLAAEYKGWLDLQDDTEARADMARHIAALANFGGGTLVLGFTDTMGFAGANPFPRVIYDRDLISSVVKKYLEPPFQCDVHIVKSAAGNDHPIVVVPPHGSSPICAKANGPLINGKIKGITQGCYYTRKPGPESAPILTAAEWAPIIRRCALHERAFILGTIDAALRGATVAPPDDLLKKWHDAAHAVFIQDVAKHLNPSSVGKAHFQLSYAIERSDGQELAPNDLLQILQQVNAEVHDLVKTGWSMFYPFTRQEIMPFFQTDPGSGQGDKDFLECALLRDPQPRSFHADMWRVAPDGKVTIIRPYWEDSADLNQQFKRKPGTWLSPNLLVRTLAEFVRHARGLAERFDAPTVVGFRCEWFGLAGREIFDPWANWLPGSIARADHRVVTYFCPVTMLANSWPEVVAEITAPVIRLFRTDFAITPDWVRGRAPTWR